MAASSADAPTNPDAVIRASDDEREHAVSELGERFAEGRLSQETFLRRMDEALGARDRRQLDRLFTDLPRRAVPRSRAALQAARDALRRAVPPPTPAAAGSRPPRALYFPPVGPGAVATFTIGRDASCDLLIEDTSVSRCHARLDREADRWLLTDVGSTNGTRVNGWRVRRPVLVQPGDYVMFGTAVFVVCAGERGQAAVGPG